jgi:hypothetical protein
MTERKPAGMSSESWVERQIREAQDRGEFDDLPGFGKPIPGDGPDSELGWVARKMREENIDAGPVLPAALVLAKETEELPRRLRHERSERTVRGIVRDLNRRILAASISPHDGPRMRTGLLDVETIVEDWKRGRAAR